MSTANNNDPIEWDKCSVALCFASNEAGITRTIQREEALLYLWQLFDMFHDFAHSMGYSGLDVQSLYDTARMLEYQLMEQDYYAELETQAKEEGCNSDPS